MLEQQSSLDARYGRERYGSFKLPGIVNIQFNFLHQKQLEVFIGIPIIGSRSGGITLAKDRLLVLYTGDNYPVYTFTDVAGRGLFDLTPDQLLSSQLLISNNVYPEGRGFISFPPKPFEQDTLPNFLTEFEDASPEVKRIHAIMLSIASVAQNVVRFKEHDGEKFIVVDWREPQDFPFNFGE